MGGREVILAVLFTVAVVMIASAVATPTPPIDPIPPPTDATPVTLDPTPTMRIPTAVPIWKLSIWDCQEIPHVGTRCATIAWQYRELQDARQRSYYYGDHHR
jgi:hypothetical protein